MPGGAPGPEFDRGHFDNVLKDRVSFPLRFLSFLQPSIIREGLALILLSRASRLPRRMTLARVHTTQDTYELYGKEEEKRQRDEEEKNKLKVLVLYLSLSGPSIHRRLQQYGNKLVVGGKGL